VLGCCFVIDLPELGGATKIRPWEKKSRLWSASRGIEMQLFYSPNSPYARKARIIIHELGLKSRVEDVVVSLPADARLRRVNPLGKVPALILDDGSVILRFTGDLRISRRARPGKILPRPTLLREAQGRWRALTAASPG